MIYLLREVNLSNEDIPFRNKLVGRLFYPCSTKTAMPTIINLNLIIKEDKNMTKLIVSVLAFLLTFFPNSTFLLSNHQNFSFLGKDTINDMIVEAINNNDADTIERLLSQHTKENGENLNQKIKDLIAAIDGNIIEYREHGSGGDGSYSNGAVAIKDESWKIQIKTDSNKEYLVCVSWVIVNTSSPEKVGMKTLRLIDTDFNQITTIYTPTT